MIRTDRELQQAIRRRDILRAALGTEAKGKLNPGARQALEEEVHDMDREIALYARVWATTYGAAA